MISVSSANGAEPEGDAVAERLVRDLRGLRDVLGQRLAGTVEVQLGPDRARERPLVLAAVDEPVERPDPQEHRRAPVEAVVLALQEVVVELALQRDPVVGVVLASSARCRAARATSAPTPP